MDAYHVIVKRTAGGLTRSDKEKESSAIKSAKAFINFKNEPAVVVIQNKRVVFQIPEGAAKDKKFLDAAMKKAYESEPTKPAANPPPPRSKPAITKPASEIKTIAKEYDAFMKAGGSIPQTHKKTDPCVLKILENAALASSLGQGIPLELAKETTTCLSPQIAALASSVSSGSKTLDQALEELVGVNPVMEEEKKPAIDVSKILRGKGKIAVQKTRIREDVGLLDQMLDEQVLAPRNIPEGLVVYSQEDNDADVHFMIAHAMGYDPLKYHNFHDTAGIPGYAYRRAFDLTRPTTKTPSWMAAGGRIGSPKTLISRIQEKYSEDQVKIVIANGVELS